MPKALVAIERKSALQPLSYIILIRLRGLVLSIHHEEENLVQTEKGETRSYQEGRTGTAAKNVQRTRDGTSFVLYQKGEFRNYPPMPYTSEEFYTILD